MINFYIITEQWKYISLSSSTSPSVIVENAPLNFVRAGYYQYTDGQLIYKGNSGYYWSTLSDSSAYSRDFPFSSSYFYPQNSTSKGFGFSVRRVTHP